MERLEMQAFDVLAKANYRRWTQPILDYFIPRAGKDFQRILDVACGPGILAREFGKVRPTVSVVGVDVSEDALRLARKNTNGMKNVSFVRGSVYQLPFKNDSFEGVLCKDSFHHFDNPEKAIREMLRVVKPGRYVYIQDMRRDLPNQLIMRSIGRRNVVETLQYYSTRASYTKKEVGEMLSQMKIHPSYLATPHVTARMRKAYSQTTIPLRALKEGLSARYNLLIRKPRMYGFSSTI